MFWTEDFRARNVLDQRFGAVLERRYKTKKKKNQMDRKIAFPNILESVRSTIAY